MSHTSRAPGVSDAEAAIRAAADAVIRSQPVPGGVLVATDRRRTLLTVPFGSADPHGALPVTPQLLFEIGSISKLLTSVLVGGLADDGLLGLEDRVVAHLPEFDAGPHTAEITIRHLLAHTAGLVGGSDAVPDGAAQVWLLRQRAAAPPGRHFHYSNVGYLALGELLRAVTGVPHWELLRQRVFVPLGMSGALTRVRACDRPRLATGCTARYDDRPWLPGDPLTGATFLEVDGADGNVALDADALARLLRFLLGNGEAGGNRVLSTQAWRRISSPAAPGGEDVVAGCGLPVTDSRYGLGVNVEQIGDTRCLTHGGGMVGYSSYVLADPDRDVAVGVLTNADGDCLAAQQLARFAHRVLRAGREGDAVPGPALLDPAVRGADLARIDGLRGTDADGAPVRLRPRVDGEDRVWIDAAGGSGLLYRDPYGRIATDHPALRLHFLHRPPAAADGGAPDASRRRALTGHYRSHTPWFANFRIVDRDGRLFLTACRGVEAPTADQELVPAGGERFRVGAEPWLPERLTVQGVAGGRAVLVDIDGCAYSRTATP